MPIIFHLVRERERERSLLTIESPRYKMSRKMTAKRLKCSNGELQLTKGKTPVLCCWSHQDTGPYRMPTWDEIRSQCYDQQNRPEQEPPDVLLGQGFYGQHPDDPFASVFGQMDDSFGQMNDVFAQMGSMFSQMDSMMRGLHQFHPGQVIISEWPDNFGGRSQLEAPERRQTPRDNLLKVPDSDPSQAPSPSIPQHPGPDIDDGDDRDSNGTSFPDMHQGHQGIFGGFHMIDPMSLFERVFRDLGLGPDSSSFEEHADGPMLPGPGDVPNENHSRESLLKQDSDLDDRDVSQLFKEGPGYSYGGGGGGSGPVVPGSSHSRSVFHSTVRITRPDGSVREETKYRDSSGREEVTVTDTRPDDSDNSS